MKFLTMQDIKITQKKVMARMPYIIFAGIIITLSVMHLAGIAGSLAPQIFANITSDIDAKTAVANNKNTASHVPAYIKIDKVGINLPVVSVPLEKGTWEVHEGVANFAEGTSLVSDKSGNVGIFAHDKENGFTKVKDLSIGDSVEIRTNDGYIALYTITSKYVIMPSNVEAFYPTDRPTLTLVTCDGAFSTQRFIVKADLVSLTKEQN